MTTELSIGARVQYTAGQAHLADRTGVVKSIDDASSSLWKLTITLDKPMPVNGVPRTEWGALWSTTAAWISSVKLLGENKQ